MQDGVKEIVNVILFLILFDPSQIINLDTTNRQQVPAIVAYENYVHVIWEDERDTTCDFDIYCRTSTDGGQSFAYEVIINFQHERNQRNPDCAVYGGIVFTVFEDYQSYYDISFAKSTNHGQSFTPSIIVNDTTRYSQRYPAIAVDKSGLLFVVWYDSYRDKDVYLSRSTDGGVSFGSSILVNSLLADTLPQYQPSIAIDNGGRVFVAFVDSSSNSIYLARSTDQGQSFNHLVQVNTSADSIRGYPDIGIDGGDRIFVTWEDKRSGDYDIYLARSTDHGTSFETEIRVNDLIGRHQRKPAIAIKDDEIYVVWEDYRSNNYDVYISKSTDHGVSFLNSVIVNDYTEKSQRYPDICSTNRLHIAWEDYRATSADIYATGGDVGISEETNGVSGMIIRSPTGHLGRNLRIYDALGRRIKKVSSPGVYFIEGRTRIKVIVIR